MPSCAAVLLVVGACLATSEARRHRGRAFLTLSESMQPQVVAQTLVRVEDEWRSEARAAAACTEENCGGMPERFQQSCGTVVAAVLQASSGDRGVVQEYLDEICAEAELKGWRSRLCQSFSNAVTAAMTADVYQNREDLNIPGVCHEFWQDLSEDEKVVVQKMQAESKAEEERKARAAAQAAKEAAVAAVVEERRRKEAAAAEESRREKEEAEHLEAEADERQQEVDKTLAEAKDAIADDKDVIHQELHMHVQTNDTAEPLETQTATEMIKSHNASNATEGVIEQELRTVPQTDAAAEALEPQTAAEIIKPRHATKPAEAALPQARSSLAKASRKL